MTFREPLFLLLSALLLPLLILFNLALLFLFFGLHLLDEHMSGHVLDIGPILKTVALILLAHICIHMRLDEYFLHLIGKGDHKAPRTELIVTFLSSWSFVVQYNIVLRLMLEGINVSIWLKCEELSGSDD